MDHPKNPTPRKVTVDDLASQIGEQPMVVAMFVGRLSQKLGIPDWRILETMLDLVRQLIRERDGVELDPRVVRTRAWDRLMSTLSPEERAEAERTGVYDSRGGRGGP